MKRWIVLGPGGLLDSGHVIAAGQARSAPVQRLLSTAPPDRVLNLTYGYPRQTVALLDNGFLVVLPLSLDDLIAVLEKPDVDET